ncbi:YihY/virulence factor BrkB family protein [Myxococcaceae bacterium GXIMD 01537]
MPHSPATMALRRLGRLLWRSWGQFSDGDGTTFAAALSFNLFFSLFPFLLLLALMGGLLLRDPELQRELVDAVVKRLPDEMNLQPTVASVVEGLARSPAGLYGLVSALALLWSSSALFRTLSLALGRALGMPLERSSVHRRAVSLGAVVATLLLVLVSLTGSTLVYTVGRWLLPARLGGVAEWGAAMLGPLLVSLLAFGLMYRFIPDRKPTRGQWVLATCVAALGFELTKAGFGVYLAHARRLEFVYGALAGVVACLLFLYLVSCVLLYAAVLARTALPGPGEPGAP